MALLNIPQIQPDEWVVGYFERLAILNGYENADVMFKHLKILKDKISVVARFLETTIQNLIQHNTLLPAFRSIVTNHVGVHHGDLSQPALIRINSLKSYSDKVRCCLSCQKEDLDYLGYIYVRRSHQTFGLEWCQKHNQNLIEIKKDAISSLIRGSDVARESVNSIHQRHPIIDRFLHISDALLSHHQPPHGDQVSWRLSRRAAAMGIRTSINGNGVPLSDFAIQHIPHNWLYKYFPNLKNKVSGQFIAAIDGVCVFRLQNHTPATYLLAAALLFDDPDDALNTILAKTKLPPPRSMLRRGEVFWNSEELYDLYIKHKGNCQSMTLELGGHYDTNRLNLLKYGLPPLTGLSAATLTALLEFHKGSSISSLYARGDIQIENFEMILRHSSPKLLKALHILDKDLQKQRKALGERLNKQPQLPVKETRQVNYQYDENLASLV